MTKKNNDSTLKKFTHSIGQNWFHLVLIPKKRCPVFQYEQTKLLAEKAFDVVCQNHKIEIFEKEVMEDHVHLFVDCPPDYGIRQLIRILKGGTSFYIRQNNPNLKRYAHLWSAGYMYRSISNVTADTVQNYIRESNVWTGFTKK
ncbi:MAG: IS200/IS605 family transposase [Nanoarchaeota archaeon]|nr:IS200/IS605 family transposase [Nanoarchaeota archaeon]